MELDSKLAALRLAEQKLPHLIKSNLNLIKVKSIDSFEVRKTHSFEITAVDHTKDDFELIISGK